VPAAIRDHAFLSDCRTAALVTRDGAVDWWPAPRFDSPSAFSALLDDEAGHWSLRPRDRFDATWRYRPGTLVLETTMRTANGTLQVTDALAFAPGARGHEIGREAPHALVRVAEALEGTVAVELECVPRLEYGLAVPRMVEEAGGVASVGGPERVFLRGERPLTADGGRTCAAFELRAGERAGWVLHRRPGAYAEAPPPLDPHATLADTTAAWRSWSDEHSGYEGEHADRVHFAAVLLQGLTFQPSGAVVAAPTTSLPEVAGGESNWDYRYGWLRDAAMVARALSSSTCSDEATRYFDWIVRAGVSCRHADQVQIVFGVEGERDLSEHALEHLDGHLGSRPVRVGNAAWRQQQLDVLGHVLDCACVVRDELGEPDELSASLLCELADRAAAQWREPDSSIWEGREGERDYVVSKLGCWVALDRAVALADRLGDGADHRRWAAEREAIAARVLRDGWSEERGAFCGAFGSDHLDAGVLLLPLSGLIAFDDPRMTRTIAALEDELGDDGLLRRWSGAEDGAFLLASFWLAECHARAGRIERAEAVFERAAGAANDLGLLAEEVDPATGDALGNVPQAISHVGLVNAAQALTEARAGASVTPPPAAAAAPRRP
jgi:GH15 family glucan-1,4-alpha-glucosidase